MSDTIWAAIVSGVLGVSGAILGTIIGGRMNRKTSFKAITASNQNAVNIMQKQEFNRATAKLRSVFAPAQSKIITEFYTDGRKLRDFFYEKLGVHAAAMEEFRPFASDGDSYQRAWDEYQKTINHKRDTDNEEHTWTSNVMETEEGIRLPSFTGVILQKIENILHFADLYKE